MTSPQWKNFQPPISDSAILEFGQSSNNFNSNSNQNSSSTTNTTTNNMGGLRETGIIEKLLSSYGFIQCCDRQARLFFHFSQFDGNLEHLKRGDAVEFEMTHDRRTGKPIASSVVKISADLLAYQVLSEDRVSGTVTTEIKSAEEANLTPYLANQGRISYENRGECFFLPFTLEDIDDESQLRVGDKVTFQIVADKRTGNPHARHVALEKSAENERYRGVVCSMKDSFGFIERADVVKEIFFHFSELKNGDTISLGDDVEFCVQTRNNKDVAVNVALLPAGTVVFDTIGTEKFKGQVLKTGEQRSRNNGNSNNSESNLPGRIKFRRDGKDVELGFGDKDQLGDFTLQENDLVQFNVACDVRDQMQRATNVELLDETFLLSGEKRETGKVAALREGFGFIKCVEREARMFFHFSELLDPEREVQVQDSVEFTVVQDSGTPSRPNAIRIRHLSKDSVKFETSDFGTTTIQGTVDREPCVSWHRSPSKGKDDNAKAKDAELGIITYQLNGKKDTALFSIKDCESRNSPRVGDQVEFVLSEGGKRNGHGVATYVMVLSRNRSRSFAASTTNGVSHHQQGYIAALKDGFGFIEASTQDKEVFFHYSVFEGEVNDLELGDEVEYGTSVRGSKLSGEGVRKLSKGTIPGPKIESELHHGTVTRTLRCFNPDQDDYTGQVQVVNEESEEKALYSFGITGLQDKKEFVQKGDTVTFNLGTWPGSSRDKKAFNIQVVRNKQRSTVEAIKGKFGFLAYEAEEGKKLFFHLSEVKDEALLQQGDEVEFFVLHNKKTGKYSACHVVKLCDAPRPERLLSFSRMRTRTMSMEDGGPRMTVVRQPKGPDGTRGFQPQNLNGSMPNGQTVSTIAED